MRIGVLALQGAFREHMLDLEALGASAVAVRLPSQLDDLHGLVIPGGESTAIAKLMRTYGFYDPIRLRYLDGMAVWGTCAGAILMADRIADARPDQEPLGLMHMLVRRNAFGRQVDSFEASLGFDGFEAPFPGVFIRAPQIEQIAEGVEVLARHAGQPVAVQQGDLLATTFHPELTGDPRVHRYFLDHVVGAR
ncbi:MAG: pyridoxal 5'-phosphate synthase glutaminase subunit PdxT [Coriobacteriia bacterium]